MKKNFNFVLVILLFFMYSCSKETATTPEIDYPKKNTVDEFDWTGIPINIYSVKGVNGEKKYLSATSSGTKVDLWGTDDKSGRQRWMLTKTSDGYYTITVDSGSSKKLYLSANSDGTNVDLWHTDDLSGRQRWSITSLGDNVFNIEIKGGVSGTRKFLSTDFEGTKTDLWETDDQTGRQQWKFESVADFELVNITYSLSPNNVVTTAVQTLAKATCKNITELDQQVALQDSQVVQTSSKFTNTAGISINCLPTKVGVPTLVADNINIDQLTVPKWTFGTNELKNDSVDCSYLLNTPAHSTYSITTYVYLYKISANYEATLRNTINGQIKKVQGLWEGVISSKVLSETKDETTGTKKVFANSQKSN